MTSALHAVSLFVLAAAFGAAWTALLYGFLAAADIAAAVRDWWRRREEDHSPARYAAWRENLGRTVR